MVTTLVTLIQNAERDGAANHRPVTGRIVPNQHRWRVAGGRLLRRLTHRGFPSSTRMSSVSVPGVDFRSSRSSSV